MKMNEIITYLVHHPYCDQEGIVKLIDRLIDAMQQIVPLGLESHRSIWIHDQAYDGQDQAWYELALRSSHGDFTLYINGETIYCSHQDAAIDMDLINDIMDFYHYLIDGVEKAIERVEKGTYRNDLETNLPLDMRYGVIRAKDLWRIKPDIYKPLMQQLRPKELHHFLALSANQDTRRYQALGEHRSTMDAATFYSICQCAYQAIGLDHPDGKPIEELIKAYASDDHGLALLDVHDARAFKQWVMGLYASNPFELIGGSQQTRIIFQPHYDQCGWSINLGAKAFGRTVELIQIYNALRDQGIAVYLNDLQMIRNRLLQLDWIGIVPKSDFPVLAQDKFPLHHLYDFIQLPQDESTRNALLPYIQWYPLCSCYVMEA